MTYFNSEVPIGPFEEVKDLAFPSRETMLVRSKLVEWLDSLVTGDDYLWLLKEAKVAYVNWETFGFTKPAIVATFQETFQQLGMQAQKALDFAKVTWLMRQNKVTSDNKVGWASARAMQFKLTHLTEWASLFWNLKETSKTLASYVCEFVWHRSWTGYDADTSYRLNLGAKRIQNRPCFHEVELDNKVTFGKINNSKVAIEDLSELPNVIYKLASTPTATKIEVGNPNSKYWDAYLFMTEHLEYALDNLKIDCLDKLQPLIERWFAEVLPHCQS